MGIPARQCPLVLAVSNWGLAAASSLEDLVPADGYIHTNSVSLALVAPVTQTLHRESLSLVGKKVQKEGRTIGQEEECCMAVC